MVSPIQYRIILYFDLTFVANHILVQLKRMPDLKMPEAIFFMAFMLPGIVARLLSHVDDSCFQEQRSYK